MRLEIINRFFEYFNCFFNIVSTILNCFRDFFICKFPVDVKINIRFFYIRTEKTFQLFQTVIAWWHTVIIVKLDAVKHVRKLPAFFTLYNNKIVNLFRIKSCKNSLKNVLIVASWVVSLNEYLQKIAVIPEVENDEAFQKFIGLFPNDPLDEKIFDAAYRRTRYHFWCWFDSKYDTPGDAISKLITE